MGGKTKSSLLFWRKGKKEDSLVDDGNQNSAKMSSVSKRRHKGKSRAAQMALETGSPPIPERSGMKDRTKGTTKAKNANDFSGRGGKGNKSKGKQHKNAGSTQLNRTGRDYDHQPVTPPSVKNTAKYSSSDDPSTNRIPLSTIQHGYHPPASSFTPKTLPPTPSPDRSKRKTVHGSAGGSVRTNSSFHSHEGNKWQDMDEEAKVKAMARLHNLGRKHAKNVTPGSRSLREAFEEQKDTLQEHAYATAEVGNSKQSPKRLHDQKIIDTVLGVNPCVPIEASKAIKAHASKPTPPTEIVNFEMIKNGSIRALALAKLSVGKLMTCAADLKDLNDNEQVCAWDQNDEEYMYTGNENDPIQASKSRDIVYDNVSEDEGTYAGISVRRGESPVSHLHSNTSMGSGVESADGSLYEGMDDVMDPVESVRRDPSIHTAPRKHTRGRPRHRNEDMDSYPTDLDTGATTGITSFRTLRAQSSKQERSRSGSPQPESSRYEIRSADPTTTTNTPFDETPDIYKQLGDGLQLAESDLYARAAENGNGDENAIKSRRSYRYDDDEYVHKHYLRQRTPGMHSGDDGYRMTSREREI